MITATVGYEGYENLYHNFVEFHTDMEYLLKRDRWSTLISYFPFFFKKQTFENEKIENITIDVF